MARLIGWYRIGSSVGAVASLVLANLTRMEATEAAGHAASATEGAS